MRKTYKGFLLIEVCAGIVLMILFTGILGSWHSRITVSYADQIRRTKALFLAGSSIEQFKAFKKVSHRKNDDYTVRWEVKPEQALRSFGYFTVTVSWMNTGKERSVCLQTGVDL